MTHKHTAGPWLSMVGSYVKRNKVKVPESYLVYSSIEPHRSITSIEFASGIDAEDLANAHLIAAAPELLEACKGIESTFVFLDSLTAGWEPQHTNTVKALAAVRAAIAKAEGA